jgi:hypothetical protein
MPPPPLVTSPPPRANYLEPLGLLLSGFLSGIAFAYFVWLVAGRHGGAF